MKSSTITITGVARLTGAADATVSRAFTVRITAETRHRVLKAAQDFGYIRNSTVGPA